MVNLNPSGGSSGSDDEDNGEQSRAERGAREARQREPEPAPSAPGEQIDKDVSNSDPSRAERGAREAVDAEPTPAPDAEPVERPVEEAKPVEEPAAEASRVEQAAGRARAREPEAAAVASSTEARVAAEEVVDATLQEGLEGRTGVDRRVQQQARDLEQRAVEESDTIRDPDDVAIRREGDELVATPSRSRQVESVEAQLTDFQEEVTTRDPDRLFAGTERVPVGVDIDPDDVELEPTDEGVVASFDEETQREIVEQRAAQQPGSGPGVDLADVEREAETASASVPEGVPFVGGLEIEGQARDLALEETDDGSVEVTEEERFGDFDIPLPGTDREFEDVTGALGGRFVDASQTVGGVAASELTDSPAGFMVAPMAPIEERVTGGTERTEEGIEGSIEGVGFFGDQALNLPQEAFEFGVEAGTRIGEGEGGEFAGEVGDAAIGAGIETGREAAQNPWRFTGQLVGSAAVTTGGIGAATRVAGPRTGRAISASVQPGEELAISAARRGAVSSRTAQLVPGVRKGHIGEGDVDSAAEGDVDPEPVEVAEPMVGRLEGRLAGEAISARARAEQASLEDVGEAATRPVRAARQRGRDLAREAKGTALGAQLSAEAKVTRGAEGLEELVRESSTPPRPEPVGVELDADELAGSDVGVEFEPDAPDASGADVGSVGGASRKRTGSGVALERVRREFRTESSTDLEAATEPRVETEQDSRRLFETIQKAEPALDPTEVAAPDLGTEAGTEGRLLGGQEAAVEPGVELGMESRVESGVESRVEPGVESRVETRVEPRQEPRLEPRLESRTEPRVEPNIRPDQGTPEPDRRRRGFGFFEKEIVAPIEENPLQAIDEDLGGFDLDLEF